MREVRVVHFWEHSPLTIVAWAQISQSTPRGLCYVLFLAPWGCWFPSLLINQHFQIPYHLGARMAQYWECSLSTNVTRVQNPDVDAICGLSLLLVLFLAPRGFSLGTLVLPSSQKTTLPNSNSTRNQVDEEPLSGCPSSKSLFIYLFISLGYIRQRKTLGYWFVILLNTLPVFSFSLTSGTNVNIFLLASLW